ncbi:MAG TPA: LamB/YcsF family protein [Candidatus Dormibacteraeota bacterium]
MIALSADVGEEAGFDDQLLGLLDAANICCGAHAGSPATTAATVRRCLELGVQVGAHPGYADRREFGRVELGLAADEIEALISEQVAVVAAVTSPVFVKPHGALFHRSQSDPAAAAAAARAAQRASAGLVGQPGFALLDAAGQMGIPAWREGYADRGYDRDGRLVDRGQPGALLGTDEAAAQSVRLARSGEIDVICLHGDSPQAVAVARAVRAALSSAGIETGPLRTT